MRTALARPIGLSAWLFTAYISVAAQVSPAAVASGISGVVTDPQGAVICGVQVTVSENSNGRKYETATDCGGQYRVNVGPGSYTVSFVKKPFRPDIGKSIDLRAGEFRNLDSKLQLNNLREDPDVKIANLPVGIEAIGTIRGTVTDPAGKPVPARITTLDYLTHTYRATTTDSDGLYQFKNLPAETQCLHYEAGEWGTTFVEVSASLAQATSVDIRFHSSPMDTIEVCTASCPIETSINAPTLAGIVLRLYAESNVAVAGSPLWLTVTLTNTTKRPIILPASGDPNPAFAYVYAYGRCGCPGLLRSEGTGYREGLAASKQKAQQLGLRRTLRIPPKGTFTNRIDLSQLMDWNGWASFGPTFAVEVRAVDTSVAKRRQDASKLPLVRSNVIQVMMAPVKATTPRN